MRSMFVNAPFSRYDLGREALRGGAGLPPIRLGSNADILKDITNVTDAESRAKLKAKYEECDKKSGLDQIVCFASLAANVYKESQTSSLPAPTVMPTTPAQPSTFPIVPVLLATIGAGALIYFLVAKGKGKAKS